MMTPEDWSYDSYEEEPMSLAGLGGVLRLELLLEPRECRGEPSILLVSWNKTAIRIIKQKFHQLVKFLHNNAHLHLSWHK